jgi:hypothetical protein
MRAFLEFLITQTVGDQRDDKTNQRLAEHGVPALRGRGLVAHWLEPAAYNGLVAGSSTAGPAKKLGYCAGRAAHVAVWATGQNTVWHRTYDHESHGIFEIGQVNPAVRRYPCV